MMSEIFSSPARPFYQSTSLMFLKPVALPAYESFADHYFKLSKKQIDPGVVKAIYERFEGTTWYLQKVLNQLYATTDHAATDDVERAVTQIIRQNEEAYKDTLLAIGQEGKASQITGMQFVKRHHLSSASSVQKAAQALLEKQLITQQQNIYEVYDKFMAEWLRFQL